MIQKFLLSEAGSICPWEFWNCWKVVKIEIRLVTINGKSLPLTTLVSLLKPKIGFWYLYTAGLIRSVPFFNPQSIHFVHKFYFYKWRKLQIPSFKYCARRMMRISKWSWRVSRFGLLLLLLPERRTAGRIGTSGTLWDTSLGYILWCCVIKL